MKTIYLAGGKSSNTAINIMKQHLESLGHRVTREAKDPRGWDVTLRWGISYHGDKPALNARVNQFDKYDCFKQFRMDGVLCPVTVGMNDALYISCRGLERGIPSLPWLARKRHHVKGKDIFVCQTPYDIEQVLRLNEHDFFSVFIPTETEYRVWVFQDRSLAVYEKQFKGEGEYEGFMRNRRFGFKFEKRDDLRGCEEIEEPCIKATKALGMNWGAVDILKGKDGKYYVLEINSMPHIDSVKRSSGIRLANAVSQWAEAQ